MIDPQTTRTFWDEAHSNKNPENLTGSTFEEELGNLRALDLVRPGAKVLNIGVGVGHTTFGLADRGCRVSAHDISPVALERVRGVVEATYVPEELPLLPDRYFDLALSHLVIQHMSDEALAVQIRHVMRSLTDRGVFAIQFATAWEQEKTSIRHDAENYAAKPYCRTFARMNEFIEPSGGAITYAEMTENFPMYRMCWYVAHVRPVSGIPEVRPAGARYAWW